MFEERAKIIRRERVGQKLTQSDLAEMVGCGLRTIQRIENAESSKDKFLEKIAEVLGLDDNQVLIDNRTKKNDDQNNFRFRRIVKGDEVYQIINNHNMKMLYDYSPHFDEESQLELVTKFFAKCNKYNQALSGKEVEISGEKVNRPSPLKVNFEFAPILIECKRKNVGIFAKTFCSVTRSRMDLEELEKYFLRVSADTTSYHLNEMSKNDLALLLYAAPFEKMKYEQSKPYLIKPQYIQLPEDYVKKQLDWHFDDLYTDDKSEFSKPDIINIISVSEALGAKSYMDQKSKEDSDYYSKFWKSHYTIWMRESYDAGVDQILWEYYADHADISKHT